MENVIIYFSRMVRSVRFTLQSHRSAMRVTCAPRHRIRSSAKRIDRKKKRPMNVCEKKLKINVLKIIRIFPAYIHISFFLGLNVFFFFIIYFNCFLPDPRESRGCQLNAQYLITIRIRCTHARTRQSN